MQVEAERRWKGSTEEKEKGQEQGQTEKGKGRNEPEEGQQASHFGPMSEETLRVNGMDNWHRMQFIGLIDGDGATDVDLPERLGVCEMKLVAKCMESTYALDSETRVKAAVQNWMAK